MSVRRARLDNLECHNFKILNFWQIGRANVKACHCHSLNVSYSVFCPGLKKGTVLLEGKGHFSARISF